MKQEQGGAIVLLAVGLSKFHNFSILKKEKDDDKETPQLFIVVQIGKKRMPTYAFVDFRIDGNTISYDFLTALKNFPLKSTKDLF